MTQLPRENATWVEHGTYSDYGRRPYRSQGLLSHLHRPRIFPVRTRPSCSAPHRSDLSTVADMLRSCHATRPSPKAPRFQEVCRDRGGGYRITGITASLRGPLKRTMGDNGGRQIDVDATERQIERPYWETTSPETHAEDKLVSA